MSGTRGGLPARVAIRAHAKINLSLRVGRARPDGYHELTTVFQSLALHDTLAFEAREGPFALSCSAPGVPADRRNLVWKAAELLWRRAGRRGSVRGVGVSLVKRIPAQGGLGGGSADGAAALVALDALWGTGAGQEALMELARRLGADVPFFLCGGTALGLGRGDEVYPLADLDRHAVVLVFPPFGVSTPEAFGWFDLDAGRRGGRARLRGTPAVVRLAGDVGLPVVNELQAPVAGRHPEVARVCRTLVRAGAGAAAMTGTGSTVFGLFTRPDQAAAAAGALEAEGWRTVVTRSVRRREARGGLRLVSSPGRAGA